jgi:hypothetical protein
MFGTKDDRREDPPPRGEPSDSPRREALEDVLIKAGDDARPRLALLELRRIELGAKFGDEGVRRRSVVRRGELSPGDCGMGAFVVAWRERRLCACERRFASLFVCRAALGVPGLEAGCCWCCIVSESGRFATRVPLFAVNVFYQSLVGVLK